jgi:hypothetical protein
MALDVREKDHQRPAGGQDSIKDSQLAFHGEIRLHCHHGPKKGEAGMPFGAYTRRLYILLYSYASSYVSSSWYLYMTESDPLSSSVYADVSSGDGLTASPSAG